MFTLGVTKKARALAVLPVLLSGYLLFESIQIFRQFAPSDSSKYFYCTPPLLLATVLIGTLVWIPRQMSKGQLILTRSGIEYDPGRHDLNMNFPWNGMIFSAPANPQQMVRSLLIAYRDRRVLLYDLFVPQFDDLVAEIKKRKKQAANAESGVLSTS